MNENVLLLYVSKDYELNRKGISELIRTKGGLCEAYVFYHDSKKGDETEIALKWSKISNDSLKRITQALREFHIPTHRKPINPDNIVNAFTEVLLEQKKLENKIFIDATSLRKSTIAKIAYLCPFFNAQLFLVIPNNFYDPNKVIVKEGKNECTLVEWTAKQTGKIEMIESPKFEYPIPKEESLNILKALSKGTVDSVKDLTKILKTSDEDERTIGDRLKGLKDDGYVNYEKKGRERTRIKLTRFGTLLLQILN